MRRGDRMLLKTNIEKMSVSGLDTMLMKTNELLLFYHDLDEKKGNCEEILNYVL